MARPTSSRQLIPSTSTAPSTATPTTTVTLETASSSNQQPQIADSLVLKLKLPKKVSWKEGTVDNEFMNKKSSKKCCIFHKEKPFDEDDSDDEGDCGHGHDHDHQNNGRDIDDKDESNHGGDGNCCNDP